MVAGEYDFAIDFALDRRRPGRPFHAVDLGGNVGYFTSVVPIDFSAPAARWQAIANYSRRGITGVFAELERRINSQPRLSLGVTLHHGLVGFREGKAYIGGNHAHYGNTVSHRARAGAIRVPFVATQMKSICWSVISRARSLSL